MSGNDFEKQVQQKMDELSFVPSNAVWPEVEKQIAGRKKRRVLFLWLPFLLLLLGGAIWMYVLQVEPGIKSELDKTTVAASKNTNEKNDKTVGLTEYKKEAITPVSTDGRIVKQQKNDRNSAVKNAGNKNHNTAAGGNKADEIIDTRATAGANAAIVLNNIALDKKTYKNNKPVIIKRRATIPHRLNKGNAAGMVATKNADRSHAEKSAVVEETIDTKAASTAEEINTEAAQTIAENKNIAADMPASGSLTNSDPSIIAKSSVTDDSIKNVSNTDTARAITNSKQHDKKARKKIEWGLSLHAGFSNISNGFSGVFSGSRSYDAAAFSSNLNSSAPSNNPGGANISPSKPSDVKSGFSYSAGMFVRKSLGNNFSVSTGLHYSYYSNHIDVGSKIDSNKALLQYNTGSAATYTNHFHFIELPVAIEKQLGKTSRFSVNGGFALSLLVASNALLYDAQKNIYAADKTHINKLQFSLQAGAMYKLFAKTLPLEIGPQFSYGAGNIFAKELYGSRHLFFTGIHARLFLSKK